LTFLFFMAFS